MDKSIILRIQKLLALGAEGSGASEAEANSAMEKAHAIMSEHNLTVATIQATGEKGSETRKKEGMDGQAMFDYQRDLMARIAEANYCYVSIIYKYTKRGAKGAGYQLIGTESNVATSKVMFEYLMQTINRLVMDEIGNDYRKRMSRWAISWCTGCANRLGERIMERHQNYLAEQKKKAKEAETAARHPSSPSHGALVVVMEDYARKEADLNADFRNGLEPGTTAARREEREASAIQLKQQKFAKAVASGFDHKVAEAFAEYFFKTIQDAHDWVYPKPQSAAEKEKDEKRWEREDRKEKNRRDKEMNKRNWTAYGKGSEAGSKIGLDAQVSKAADRKAIK